MKLQSKHHSDKTDFWYPLKCGVASFAATCISVTTLHPLQLVKVRFQSNDGQANEQNVVPKYRGLWNAFRQIMADEGFRGLYKGLSVAVTSAAIAASLFFTIYEKRKKALLKGKNLDKEHEMYQILLAGIQSGFLVTIMTQPMWVVKTRTLLNTQKDIKETKNVLCTIKQIYKQHGFTGFYKGLSMNILVSSFSGAVQMFIYEGSKKIYDKLGIPQSDLMERNFLCGGIAKIGTVFFFYPLTTIRTRIQQNQFVKAHPNDMKYHNLIEIILKTWRLEGITGFYKGMLPNIIRGIPERGLYFYSYQMLKKLLLLNKSH